MPGGARRGWKVQVGGETFGLETVHLEHTVCSHKIKSHTFAMRSGSAMNSMETQGNCFGFGAQGAARGYQASDSRRLLEIGGFVAVGRVWEKEKRVFHYSNNKRDSCTHTDAPGRVVANCSTAELSGSAELGAAPLCGAQRELSQSSCFHPHPLHPPAWPELSRFPFRFANISEMVAEGGETGRFSRDNGGNLKINRLFFQRSLTFFSALLFLCDFWILMLLVFFWRSRVSFEFSFSHEKKRE